MRGDPEIIEALNDVLTAELTAINQYFAQSKMCANWGYKRLAARFREESIDEMKDAEVLIDRILYFEGVPNMQRLFPVRIGENPKEQLQAALETEVEAIARLNRGIALARERGDNGTRDILEHILRGEEEGADWLESQLHLIEQLGLERYLAEMIRE
jgi:bacterioferritin